MSNRGEADTPALAAETRRARALDFACKLAIHPAQLPVIAAAFAPSQEEVAQAWRVVAARDTAAGGSAWLD